MKPSLTLLAAVVLIAFPGRSFAAAPPAEGRTLTDISAIPSRVLQNSISRKFYKSLLVSPIQGWIVVRGTLSGTHLTGMRVIHSELNGLYDPLALKLAKEALIAGAYTIDRPNAKDSVLLHLLIYQIADGTMALSFAHLDGPGGIQSKYFGCARLAVLKDNGKWVDIKGPETLEGKGWAVRAAGLGNDLTNLRKMERIPGLDW